MLSPLVRGDPAEAGRHVANFSHARISASTSSRFAAIISGVVASRFSRSSGSVFDGRTLKCQSGYSTEMPSSVY